MSRLILFPRRNGKQKKGDAPAEEVKAALSGEGITRTTNVIAPISNKFEIKEGKLSDYPSEEGAYKKLRQARSEARLVGAREKRAKAKAEEASAAKK